MLIVCPSCATSYDVQPASLQPDGRQVRCVRCRTVWHAEPTQQEKLLAAAAALAPEPEPEQSPPHMPAEPAEAEDIAFAEAAAEASEIAAGEPPLDVEAAGEPADPLVDADAGSADGFDPEAAWSVAAKAEPEPIVEVEAPPIVPVDLDSGRLPVDFAADRSGGLAGPRHDDIETLAARRFRRGGKRGRQFWSLSRFQTFILGLVVFDAVIVGWRKDIVRVLPQTASFYASIGLAVNVRGLSFDDVVTSTQAHEGVPILVVQGKIVNDTATTAAVPRLKLAVRNGAKQEIYSWTAAPPRATLPPYQAVEFRTRLASPPTDSHDVLVRFLTRRDVVAETP